jgi:hypothetical protein
VAHLETIRSGTQPDDFLQTVESYKNIAEHLAALKTAQTVSFLGGKLQSWPNAAAMHGIPTWYVLKESGKFMHRSGRHPA